MRINKTFKISSIIQNIAGKSEKGLMIAAVTCTFIKILAALVMDKTK